MVLLARRWLIFGMALLGMLSAAALNAAQDMPTAGPIDLIAVANLAVDDSVLAAAFPTDDHLIVLSGDRAAVYDIALNGSPGLRLRSNIALDGHAQLLAAGAGYALTSTETSEGEFLTIIAPSTYNPRRGWEAVSLLQLPDEALSLAAGQSRGLIGLSDGYAALEILSADSINHRLVNTGAAVHQAGIFGELAFITSDDETEPALEQILLTPGPTVAEIQSVGLQSPVLSLAISEADALGAALLADHTVIIFDPATGAIAASLAVLEDMDSLVIAQDVSGQPHIVLSGRDRAALQIISLNAPAALPADTVVELSESPTAIAARGHLLAIADADSIAIYRLSHRV